MSLSAITIFLKVARQIFARMKSFIIYRIACTLQLLVFFFLSVLFIHPSEWVHEENVLSHAGTATRCRFAFSWRPKHIHTPMYLLTPYSAQRHVRHSSKPTQLKLCLASQVQTKPLSWGAPNTNPSYYFDTVFSRRSARHKSTSRSFEKTMHTHVGLWGGLLHVARTQPVVYIIVTIFSLFTIIK